MSENITKELREWNGARIASPSDKYDLLRIADRIDAAHDEGVRQGYDIGFASADDWYADKTDDDLAEHGLVRLPVDANGKPWRIGDMAECESERFKVCEVIRGIDGVYIRGTGQRFGYKASDSRHYKPSTPAERLRTIADRLANGEDAQGFVSELADIAAEVDG